MVKRFSALILALFLLSLPLFAMAESQHESRVWDDADLYSDEQIQKLEAVISAIQKKYQVDVAILTTRDIPTGSTRVTRDYADKYYEDNGLGLGGDLSGVIFVVDMNNRYNYLSTAGIMIDYLNDGRIESILSSADDYLYSGLYYEAMRAELTATERYLSKGIEEGSFRFDEETGERLSGLYNKLTGPELILSLGAGAVVAAIIIMSVHSSYQLKGSTYRYDVKGNSQRSLTRDEETFLRQTVSRQRIVRDTGSSGGSHSGGSSSHGSSVHVSSGGMSHGGGGHHF